MSLLDPSELLDKLGDKAEEEFADKGAGWFDDLLGEGRKLVDEELDDELKDGATEALDKLEAGKAPILRLGEFGLAKIVGYFGTDKEEDARNVYIATTASYEERRKWMQEGGDLAQKDREERDKAWEETKETLKEIGMTGLKLLAKLLAGALKLV